MSEFTVAACQYPIDFLSDWQHYRDKLEAMVGEAAGAGARLLVFPEYAAMELASLFPEEVYRSLSRQLEAIQDCLGDFLALHGELARRHGVHILAGSFPVAVGQGYRNRSYLFTPAGEAGFQEKLIMTRFENERWRIQAGDQARVFVTELGVIGVNICYDSEFPLLARSQVEAGAELILVPSCTDSLTGFNRVRIGSQARALENQCYVVQSHTVGRADWSEAVDVNAGAGAIHTPVDHGFPASGTLAMGEPDLPGWVYAPVDLQRAREIRASGQVFNHRDWPRQHQALAGGVERVRLA